ncbi:prepilin peptidase [Paenibacillus spiritus]|uniref:Prepilin peptidase n=1 Tax=Paenibacillus spiritus TaxID=2496557 RepID=A0A5J5FWA7_9BACL|nr:A24 family peptidase [Paenibacillus spiritus]KAA8997946.1 prepilin peptidase [Paenibacillus spiritus]
MTIAIAIYLALLGLALGSFYNVVALRVPAGESLTHPPSHCTACGRRLTARDLVPVFSWLASGGRCRHCGAKVSVLYPLGELATGLLFLWSFLTFGLTGSTLTALALSSLAVLVTVADLKYMLIPNKVLLFFLPLLGLLTVLFPQEPMWSHGLGLLAGAAILFPLVWFGGMGMGDLKLFALLGLALGWQGTLLAFLLACLLGTLIMGSLRLAGKIGRKQQVPFGPFLAVSALIAYAYGPQIIGGYLSLIR